jgi:omega-6 fatty acid desaturase (delta-12 desaturase)
MSEIIGGAAPTSASPPLSNIPAPKPAWVAGLKKYEKPNGRRVAVQILDTLVPYAGLLVLMYMTMVWNLPYVVTLLLAVPASALMVRIFIFFHDCSHGSYVASPLGLKVLGNIFGTLTFTPYADWRHSHGIHHSTSGNLDRRGIGDIWTMTADEFAQSSPLRRFLYRFYRNPFVMFGLGPFFIFVVGHRLPSRGTHKPQVLSVLFTDLLLAGIITACVFTIGIKAYLLIQLPIMFLGGAGGVWLFYVQHQFDPSYWARTEEWGSM